MWTTGCFNIKRSRSSDLADVDAGHLVSLSVPVAELRHGGDGVQAGVLSQRRGDHLKGVAVRPHAVGLHAAQSARVLRQTHGQLDLWSAAAGYQSPEGRRNKVNKIWPNFVYPEEEAISVTVQITMMTSLQKNPASQENTSSQMIRHVIAQLR